RGGGAALRDRSLSGHAALHRRRARAVHDGAGARRAAGEHDGVRAGRSRAARGARPLARRALARPPPHAALRVDAARLARRERLPRVDRVASQVDLAPTILGLTGLAPRLAPFMGADLSCVIVSDCRPEFQAVVLTSHTAGLVGDGRILAYGLKTGRLRETDLALGHPRDIERPDPRELAAIERLKALLVSSTLLVDQNRVWSWARFGEAL